MMTRSLVAICGLSLAACGSGSSMTAPSGAPPPGSTLPFQSRVYRFSLSGSELVVGGLGDPVGPGCLGLAQSGIESVATEVTLSLERDGWHARPISLAGGAFDVRFVEAPEGPGAPGGGHGLVGMASGLVISTFASALEPNTPVPDSRALLGGSSGVATLNGGVAIGGFVASGYVSGEVSLAKSDGTTVRCNSHSVGWLLN